MNFTEAMNLVRYLRGLDFSLDAAINNPAVPSEFRQELRETFEAEDTVIFRPAKFLVNPTSHDGWLIHTDRQNWYYWPTLRGYLLGIKGWKSASVRSLDETTDRILELLAPPEKEQFDIRGLVVGFVQSGKTANYTALIAKAADVGYRLIIILSGIDNGLRMQTQIRLNKELVGYAENHPGAVHLPPVGKRWHQFTTEDINGDFRPGNANHAALQGNQPVLLVIKKNGAVLRRLRTWIETAPEDVRRNLPVLVIDDEADQASVDTRGSYIEEEEPIPDDYEEPSVINGLIRDLIKRFQRVSYVAYTATPFANILIPHDNYDPYVEDDLYPRDFIVDLPKPDEYFGSEELFGRLDLATGEQVEGLNVIRSVPETDFDELHNQILPTSLENAIIDFVLSGAGRAQRGMGNAPATMLIHGSHLVLRQYEIHQIVSDKFSELKDEWRYQRNQGILEKLRERWENEFRPVTREYHLDRDVDFSLIEPFVGPFFESVQVKVINSASGAILDYEHEPGLKAIAVGGNRLSRGLTLEGLQVSYFIRKTIMYDTLMQMGRWFGFRRGYEDLTRIYMTDELAGWFNILSMVEHELRQDISRYEAQNITPLQLATRILYHPSMLVTSRLKQRHAQKITVQQSYSNQVLQTIRFPFEDLTVLNDLLSQNISATQFFLSHLGSPDQMDGLNPIWMNVSSELVLHYLLNYSVYSDARTLAMPLIIDYIKQQNEVDELIDWTIAVKGRSVLDLRLGDIDLGTDQRIPTISRTRLKSDPFSLGVITSPGDETTGLTPEQRDRVKQKIYASGNEIGLNPAAREERSPRSGLLLIYPVSRFSGYNLPPDGSQTRKRIYSHPEDPLSIDIICLAISFPKSDRAVSVSGEYVVGTVGWVSQ